MSDYDFLLWTPLLTAAVWVATSAHLVYREQYRTWTELFFLGLCLMTGGYGIADAVFFNTLGQGNLLAASAVSLSCLTLGSAFLALYGMSLHGRFRPAMLLAFVPALFLILTFPTVLLLGFQALPGGPPPSVPVYNPPWFLAFLLTIGVLWILGIVQIARTLLEVRRHSPLVARRIGIILLSLVVALVAGALSNALLGLNNITQAPPLFSTMLAIPGILIFFATTPSASRRINEAVLRRKSALFDVKAAFLTFSDGTLIGFRVQPEESMIDADAFSATLDVIQNFMRTSFPTLRGKWLKSIRQGDYTLVMEKGRFTFLTLVLGGEENDQLRRRVIEGLTAYEEQNEAALERWRGMAEDASGTENLLESMLAA